MAKYNSVTDNEIEQAKKYKDALDELQKSVVGLNSKLPSFADGLKAGLQGIGEKLPPLVEVSNFDLKLGKNSSCEANLIFKQVYYN
ncbi:hypothetical protein EWM62_03760 [Mucilaginibacter terrigena]|uniref:Uncharacterized protein n=1 Tax=Mucilaginibacter terrigena TaxID=2492395 RepID=A0A4Q5LNW8_9SPHI|nr:hypothetical protein [Mucilaginibacter terrigena]RYU91063.1 hypothetical protein EWM62_03760 [Mucilaginibacter terrigena]